MCSDIKKERVLVCVVQRQSVKLNYHLSHYKSVQRLLSALLTACFLYYQNCT